MALAAARSRLLRAAPSYRALSRTLPFAVEDGGKPHERAETSVPILAARAAVASGGQVPADSVAKQEILDGDALPSVDYRDEQGVGGAPLSYLGYEYDVTSSMRSALTAATTASPHALRALLPPDQQEPSDSDWSEEEGLDELLANTRTGDIGLGRFYEFIAKNPAFRPSLAREARKLGTAAFVRVGQLLDKGHFEKAAQLFAETDGAARPSDSQWFWSALLEAYIMQHRLVSAVAEASGEEPVEFSLKAYTSVVESCFEILPPATAACPDSAILHIIKPLHTSPALISFLEKHAAAGNFSSQLCHTALETEFCTIFFSLAELWNVAVEKSHVAPNAESDKGIGTLTKFAAEVAKDLEKLLKLQGKLSGMAPSPHQLDCFARVGYMIGGAKGFEVIKGVLKEHIQRGVPLSEALLITAYNAASDVSEGTGASFAKSIAEAVASGKAALNGKQVLKTLQWKAIVLQNSETVAAEELAEQLLATAGEGTDRLNALDICYQVLTTRLPTFLGAARKHGVPLNDWLEVAMRHNDIIPAALMEVVRAYAPAASPEEFEAFLRVLSGEREFYPPIAALDTALAKAPAKVRAATTALMREIINANRGNMPASLTDTLLA